MWRDFFKKLEDLRSSNEPFAVGTVVDVSGSTYRRPGARVLITKDGTMSGLISGGCFESDLIDRAKQVLKNGQPATVSFDTTSPDDLIFGLGLGCTGIAHILIEPYRGFTGQDHLNFIFESVQNRTPAVLSTVFRSEAQTGARVGAHLMLRTDQHSCDNMNNQHLIADLLEQSRHVLHSGASRVCEITTESGNVSALVEFINLPVPLLIFGAGPDAVPLVQLAKHLGWTVTVIDRRPAFTRPDRFPSADAVLLCEPEDLLNSVTLDARTVAVVMTHHFDTDSKYLKALLPSAVSYIGILGPKAKTELLLQSVRDQGIDITEQQLSRVYGPVGLDIGAETPEEIALAIVSEIQSVETAHSAGFLRERRRPIHGQQENIS